MAVPDLIEGATVDLIRVTPEAAAAILAGSLPTGIDFVDGFPGEFSVEVMDLYVGERSRAAIGFTPFFIRRREDGRIVGDIGFSFPDGRRESPSVGYDVVEPLWGRGYATAALQTLVAFLMSQPEIESVRADTLKSHIASRRVMEKAGMRFVRESTDDVDGVNQQVVYYEIGRPGRRIEPRPPTA